ncbi:hypothetical protein CMQ_4131 [Grosmannia clavigera kw1407]|uniref:Uncharacterized protein n=1 Tax=Grosmannia clavigera (strain kw1407 / UAMH 11150) TaxID=655863 RepID=F0X8H8_GROCL|nr:uncharacterized protein CMQ_4131 [Grosmannia clavigera kw1407]EFX06062.1 hypothetical protein CMQ_4131 [Grosmannia clavigera kw1407]
MACPLVPELRDSFTFLFETGSYSDLVVKSSVKTYNILDKHARSGI